MKLCLTCTTRTKIEKIIDTYKQETLQGKSQDGPTITSKQSITINLLENKNQKCTCRK